MGNVKGGKVGGRGRGSVVVGGAGQCCGRCVVKVREGGGGMCGEGKGAGWCQWEGGGSQCPCVCSGRTVGYAVEPAGKVRYGRMLAMEQVP